ncbi:MAG: cyclase family protein [Firmicutes bacterium]|nr:cyclase family protein [Bacillota bacterium]
MTEWIDVTWILHSDLPVWPGEVRPVLDRVSTVEADGVQSTHLNLGAHTGTHIDAPRHFIAGGATIEEIPLEILTGPCLLVDCQGDGPLIEVSDLEGVSWEDVERVVFRTRSAFFPMEGDFRPDFVALSLSAAEFLVAKGIRLVGIDYLSVERFEANSKFPVHKALLGAGVVVIEGLKLRDLKPGLYELVALPLLLEGSEGSPARVLMRPLE